MSKETHEEARRLWVEKLRSGEYEQGTNYLQSEGKYCCLGVACELFIASGGNLVRENRRASVGRRYVEYGSALATTPPEVAAWLGLRSLTGRYGSGSLARDNDRGKTFAEIADIIESRPAGLFVD